MWQVYATIAMDRMRERQQQAERVALARLLADDAAARGPAGPSSTARVAAIVLRGLAGAASAVSARAGTLAARLERRAA
jgi:hypothetical protein